MITKKAVMEVLRDYTSQYKKRPFQTTLAICMPALGSILVFFIPPLIVAKLVNIVSSHQLITFESIAIYIGMLGFFWLLGEAFWRVGLHYLIKIETVGLNRLNKNAFKRLTERDYNFYTNNFVGSLTKMALAYSRGFEIFTDALTFNVIGNVLPIIFAVIILWHYSYVMPVILIGCLIIAIIVALPIIRKRSKLVAARHDSNSKMAGRFSDSMTNIMAVKAYAAEADEQKTFGALADDNSVKFKKAADYQNLRFDIVISPIYVLTNVIGLAAAVFFTQTLGLQVGVMVVVCSYYSAVTRFFWDISRVYRNFESSISEAAEFTQLLIDPPAVRDAEGAIDLRVIDSTLAFKDVGF